MGDELLSRTWLPAGARVWSQPGWGFEDIENVPPQAIIDSEDSNHELNNVYIDSQNSPFPSRESPHALANTGGRTVPETSRAERTPPFPGNQATTSGVHGQTDWDVRNNTQFRAWTPIVEEHDIEDEMEPPTGVPHVHIEQDEIRQIAENAAMHAGAEHLDVADTTEQPAEEWNPTEAELLAIAFADDDDGERDRQDLRRDPNTERDGDDNNAQVDAERVEDRGHALVGLQHPEDNDSVDGPTPAEGAPHHVQHRGNLNNNHTNDPPPPPVNQNPWGMTDAEIDILISEQHRVFGFVRDRDSAPKPFECVCGDSSMEPTGFVNLTCEDNCVRCVDCLNQNVRVGLESRKNYPPKCCIPIDFENVLDHLEPELLNRWLDVRVEFEDVAPVYCSVKECSKYIYKSSFIGDGKWAPCDECNIKTCSACLCSESQHDPLQPGICPERLDKMDKDLMKREGWKPCPSCRQMIERTEGCDHMMCECGHEFCYRCGRSYQPPFPCNCNGQNVWAEEQREEIDPNQQANMFDRMMRRLRRRRENRDANAQDDGDDDDENVDEDGDDIVDGNVDDDVQRDRDDDAMDQTE